jgi:hypothetical protein
MILHKVHKKEVTMDSKFKKKIPYRVTVRIFLFIAASRPVLGPTQTPIQWVSWVKRPGREADHSLPSSAEVNEWSYTSTPSIRLHGVVLN